MDINMDYVDNNYAWQRRILTVFKNCKPSNPFPYAAAIGVEYNPTFERKDKINAELITNGVILDINDFVKSVTKSACFHLLDILSFNFNLGLDVDRLLCYAFASKVYSSAKSFKDQFKTRPLQLHSKLQDIFPLPDPTLENADLFLQTSELKTPIELQLSDERKGDPFLINKGVGRSFQINMDYYPLCKKSGVNFVLRPANAPAQKLSTTLLTGGMILEMLDFARVLSGSYPQMLKDIISHNFGEVFEPYYVSGEVKALSEKKKRVQQLGEFRESFYEEPFKFMHRRVKRLDKIHKRPRDLDSDVEIIPEKRRSEVVRSEESLSEATPSNPDYVWKDEEMNEASYMCPVEFETDFPTDAGPDEDKNEEELVDVEFVAPETSLKRVKLEELYAPPKTQKMQRTRKSQHFGFQYMRKPKTENTPAVLFSDIFCEDTLPMCQKTVKQKEWTRRTNRIKEIFNKGIQNLFCRCREIGLDFNVGSGRKQNLDMNLITNHTLFEVNRFSVHLSKSVSVFLMDIMERNFTLCFNDEAHERNFMSYLLGKERPLYNHAYNESFMNTPLTFPEGYNVVDLTRECDGGERSDDVPGEYKSEFPYCADINLNLWSLDEKPAGRKLDLAMLTNGALFEILTFTRHLASNQRDLFNDILEHNFDVDLQDPETEDSHGLNKWFAANKLHLKKPFSVLKTSVWLTEEISLKQYSLPKQQQLISKMVMPVSLQKAQEYRYDICKEIGLELNVSRKSQSKQKLDMRLLTRGALFEVHHFVKTKCNRYVPALFEILDYNFDLSSQRHRKVELAWSIAAQVLAMVRKGERGGRYMQRVFELPFEPEEGDNCKEEPEEREIEEAEPSGDDVVFVQKLIPVDITVEIE